MLPECASTYSSVRLIGGFVDDVERLAHGSFLAIGTAWPQAFTRSVSRSTISSASPRRCSGYLPQSRLGSSWWPFPVEDLHAVQALCYDQRQRFLTDAAEIHVQLREADADV
jgi:hypothetical protein